MSNLFLLKLDPPLRKYILLNTCNFYLREWARVALCCRALQRLQPSTVTIASSPWIMNRAIPGHIASVLQWSSRHLEVGHPHAYSCWRIPVALHWFIGISVMCLQLL